MSKNKGGKKNANRILGTYALQGGQAVVGELKLKGAKTLLKLHSDEYLQKVENGACIHGVAYNGDCVSLIDCRSPGTGITRIKDGPTRYHAEVFPHYVAVGRRHLDPNETCIARVDFITTDLTTLFYDFDAFGLVLDAKPIIDVVLAERRAMRPVETGERPRVFYYTGKECILEVETIIGKISIHHSPSYSMGGPTGASIKNRIAVSIQPKSAISLDIAIDRMYQVCCFLSTVAGRIQGIEEMAIDMNEAVDGVPQMLIIHESYRWKSGGAGKTFNPEPLDVPLDPINHKNEFCEVITDWIERHEGWRVARGRYIGCLRKANKYGAERLVAAANMFDILPVNALPPNTSLEYELAKTRDECIQMLRKLPQSADRNGALSALGRLGQPSLPKKVAYRASIVEKILGARFPDLQYVANTAVKCRNFYVHGSSGDIEFAKVEPLVGFLTDALEFIFATSDLIEAGWDAARWYTKPKGMGHTFARFSLNYDISFLELRKAMAGK
jgi:hypothetical protein